MCTVPGRRIVAAALLVVMSNLCTTFGAARPVGTGLVSSARERSTIELRPGENVVTIRRVATAIHHVTALGERSGLPQPVRRAMQIRNIHRDPYAPGIVPRTRTDAVSRVNGGLPPCRARAEVRVPGSIPCSRRAGE